jgi:hypothetical protein
MLFVNKKRAARPASKKTLLILIRAVPAPREAEQKFFGYFFSKK